MSEEQTRDRLPDYFKALEMPWHVAAPFMSQFVDDDEQSLGYPTHHARRLFDVAQALLRELEQAKARIREFDKSIDAEMRDPNGTIWEVANQFLAERDAATKEVERLKAVILSGWGPTPECVAENKRLAEDLAEANVERSQWWIEIKSLREKLAEAKADATSWRVLHDKTQKCPDTKGHCPTCHWAQKAEAAERELSESKGREARMREELNATASELRSAAVILSCVAGQSRQINEGLDDAVRSMRNRVGVADAIIAITPAPPVAKPCPCCSDSKKYCGRPCPKCQKPAPDAEGKP